MAEKTLVTPALDERELLVIMINAKIDKANFVDYAKNNEDKVIKKRITRAEFAKNAKASYEQIIDMIRRYQKINDAIILS